MAGAAGASRLGLGAAGQAAGAYAGQLAGRIAGCGPDRRLRAGSPAAGLNSATIALRGDLPTAQEFMDGAVLILGFNAGAKLSGPAGARVRAVRDKLIDITERTGLTPEAVAKDVQANPEYARSVLEEPGAKTYIFAKTVESAAKHMGAESPLSYLRQTPVEVVEVAPRFGGKDAREIRRTQGKALEKEIAGDYRCEQTGEVMYLPRGGVDHAEHSAFRPGEGRLSGYGEVQMEAVANFPAIIERAVLGEVHPSKTGEGLYTSRYYSVMRINNETFVVKITAIRESGKAVSRAEIESIDRVHDMYLTKKLPESVKTATPSQPGPGQNAQPTPGSNSNILTDTTPVNSGKISLFHVLEGLKDSADKKTPLFRPSDSE